MNETVPEDKILLGNHRERRNDSDLLSNHRILPDSDRGQQAEVGIKNLRNITDIELDT